MDLLQHLQARGLHIRIDGRSLIVGPSELLTDDIRAAIRADKPELLRLPESLMDAINRCCAARGDDAANRAALILECSVLPAWEQRELRDHFNEQAAMWQRANGGGRS
jgi:hypothetical protein